MAYTLNNGHAKPYIYQEYPRRMYKWHETPCSVNSDADRAAKEGEGWSVDPVFAPPSIHALLRVESPVHIETPAAELEAPADTATVVAVAPRRGRPPKVRP